MINYESTDTVLRVTVSVDDATIGTSPDDSAELVVQVIDVNEAPTLVVQPLTTSLQETASTVADRLVANMFIYDDALGTNTLSLSGFGGSVFKIFNNQLFLLWGTACAFRRSHGCPELQASLPEAMSQRPRSSSGLTAFRSPRSCGNAICKIAQNRR